MSTVTKTVIVVEAEVEEVVAMKKIVSTLGLFALAITLFAVPTQAHAEGFFAPPPPPPAYSSYSTSFAFRASSTYYNPGYNPGYGMPPFGGSHGYAMPYGGGCGGGYGAGCGGGGYGEFGYRRYMAGGCGGGHHMCRRHHRCERHRKYRSFSLNISFGFGFGFGLSF